MKRRAVTGAEQDVTSRWRRLLCYTQRAGVTAGVKRQMRRRERREGSDEIEDLMVELVEAHNEHWHPGRSCGPHDRCQPAGEEE